MNINPSVLEKAAIGASLGFAVSIGVIVGHVITKRKMEAEFQSRLEHEVEATKKFYSSLKKEDFKNPADAVEHFRDLDVQGDVMDEIIKDRGYIIIEEEPRQNDDSYHDGVFPDDHDDNYVEVAKNVFTDAVDFEEEYGTRDPSRPYIIQFDEFAETSFDVTTITFYEGDGILCDEKNDIIENLDEIIGENNLQFGHGSRDNNIVYIRNEVIELDFEVVRDPGKYTEEVLKFIEHSSDRRGPLKFRNVDD